MRGVPPIIEMLAGAGLTAVAVSQLVAGARTFPSFAETLAMIILLLVGIALIYLGFERQRDHASSRAASHHAHGEAGHARDDERW